MTPQETTAARSMICQMALDYLKTGRMNPLPPDFPNPGKWNYQKKAESLAHRIRNMVPDTPIKNE